MPATQEQRFGAANLAFSDIEFPTVIFTSSDKTQKSARLKSRDESAFTATLEGSCPQLIGSAADANHDGFVGIQ